MSKERDHLWELDRRSLWHPYTRFSALEGEPFPIIVRGEGPYLFDSDGRRYFDAISSWWCCNLGHGQPRITEAIIAQTRQLQHSIIGNLSHPPAIELADRLCRLFPDERRVLFSSDGASAVEVALKIAVQYWHNRGHSGKNRLASLEYAYHGDTFGAMAVGHLEEFHAPFRPLLCPVFKAESPCCGTCRRGLNPASCGLPCFESIHTIIATHAKDLAAVIVEPLCQGAAGMRIYPALWLKRLAEECARYEVLLIVDEIAMGFGRTGTMFAFEQAGISPDIVCVGKGLSGGTLPISATVVKASIQETFADRPIDHTLYHGHTFAGNPIAAAASLATLQLYEEEKIVACAAERGKRLAQWMDVFRGHPRVRDVRCLGMITAVELYPDPDLILRWRTALRCRGLLMRPLGPVFYLMPPLNTADSILQEAIAQWRAALDEVASA